MLQNNIAYVLVQATNVIDNLQQMKAIKNLRNVVPL